MDTQALPIVVIDPRRGDTLPDPAEVSGAVVTGSHAMVSHREPWSETTAAWLAQLVSRDTPVLGICYGHQLLAHALGGEAGNHPQGVEVGTVTVTLEEAAAGDALLRGLPAQFPANVVHWQSALRLPEGAVRLAGNAHEPVQAFRVGGNAWGVQFHPEFDAGVMRGYIDMLAGDLSAEGQTRPRCARTWPRPTRRRGCSGASPASSRRTRASPERPDCAAGSPGPAFSSDRDYKKPCLLRLRCAPSTFSGRRPFLLASRNT